MKLLQIGFGNAVVAGRVKQILRLKSTAGKNWRQEADRQCKLIDATAGRHTKSILITDSGHIILSSLASDTLSRKLQQLRKHSLRSRPLKKPAKRSVRTKMKHAASG